MWANLEDQLWGRLLRRTDGFAPLDCAREQPFRCCWVMPLVHAPLMAPLVQPIGVQSGDARADDTQWRE